MRFLFEVIGHALGRIADGDGSIADATLRTLALAFAATGTALLLGLPLGLAIGMARPRRRRAGFTLANAGLGLPAVVLGILLALFLLPGSPLGALQWTYTVEAVWLAMTLLALPIVVALTATAVAALPTGLLAQAEAFGAGWWARAALALREARIGVLVAVIAALGSAVAEVGAVVIVGGNVRGQTNTLTSTVLLDLAAGDPVAATADVIVLLVLVLALAALLTAVQHRAARRPGEAPGSAPAPPLPSR